MAVYAVGDLQGCAAEFDQLLDALGFDPAVDRLWLTGDLVNRGDDSLGALRRVHALGDACLTVLGNHDFHLLAVAAGAIQARRQDTLDAVLAADDRMALIDWLRHRPLLHVDAALDYALVHAGIPPDWTLDDARRLAGEVEDALRGPRWARFVGKLYSAPPPAWRDEMSRKARRRFTVAALTRLRYCDAAGQPDFRVSAAPGTQPAGLEPWFDVPSRRTARTRVVFGHWSTLGFLDRPDVLALDTGCVWGGRLTAVRLDAPAPPVSIGCRQHRVPGR